MPARQAISERLYKRLKRQPDGCVIWTGAISPNGYGTIRTDSPNPKTIYVHRLAYELALGEITEKHDVHHKCENKLCCNPNHLKICTRGEHMWNHTKYDQKQIADIIYMYKRGVSLRGIGRTHGTDHKMIKRILEVHHNLT